MDFCSKLNKAVTVDRMVNTEVSCGKLIPNIYQYNFNTPNSGIDVNHYLHLGGGGNIEIVLPSSFHFSPLKCMMLLYSEQGADGFAFRKRTFLSQKVTFFSMTAASLLPCSPLFFHGILRFSLSLGNHSLCFIRFFILRDWLLCHAGTFRQFLWSLMI